MNAEVDRVLSEITDPQSGLSILSIDSGKVPIERQFSSWSAELDEARVEFNGFIAKLDEIAKLAVWKIGSAPELTVSQYAEYKACYAKAFQLAFKFKWSIAPSKHPKFAFYNEYNSPFTSFEMKQLKVVFPRWEIDQFDALMLAKSREDVDARDKLMSIADSRYRKQLSGVSRDRHAPGGMLL